MENKQTESRSNKVSSFTIKMGSLIEEIYTAFKAWDFKKEKQENLRLFQENNPIGANSESWLKDVASVINRLFQPDDRDRALVYLAQHRCDLEIWKPLLLWHMTRDEFLVRDFFINWLYPKYSDGVYFFRNEDLHPYLKELPKKGVTSGEWTNYTILRVARGLTIYAEDFGMLKGSVKKEFLPYHLPEQSFLYLLHAIAEVKSNATGIIRLPDWKMYLMSPADVEGEILHLHQFKRLQYEVAGSLGQLTLPCASAYDYAREMVK